MRIKAYGCSDRFPWATRNVGVTSIVFDQNSIKLSACPRGKRGGMTDDVRTSNRTSQVTQAMETRTLQAQEFQVPFLSEAICIALPGTKKGPLSQYLLTRLDVALSTGYR